MRPQLLPLVLCLLLTFIFKSNAEELAIMEIDYNPIGRDYSEVYLPSYVDQVNPKIELYPNPVKRMVTLKLPSKSNGIVTFYNLLGEEVLRKQINSQISQIDLSKLKSGAYLVTIKTEDITTTKKLIKL